jgi:S-adenosylmethionine:tRNA ribosyltransferase-isomerase
MHPKDIPIADLTYDLPVDRIAQKPLAERDASKLLVFRNGSITNHIYRDLPGLLPAGSLLVLNNTRVVNARLFFHRSTGGKVEIFCLSPVDGKPADQALQQTGATEWNCLVGNGRKWAIGTDLQIIDRDITFTATRIASDRVRISWQPAELTFAELLDQYGHVPLPPYMKRPDEIGDKDRYNTVFAQHEGSVAAPTASLHFSKDLLQRLSDRNVKSTEVTLHVGAGTFQPVKSDRMEGHLMHQEQIHVPLSTLKKIAGQIGKGPIIPVGTTALRTIESLYWHGLKILNGNASDRVDVDQWEPYGDEKEIPPIDALRAVIDLLERAGRPAITGSTRLLIAPGYRFRFADALVTNFHQPQSTLLLLIAAFIGPDWRKVYDHALRNEYRFLSYGDGSLLWRS